MVVVQQHEELVEAAPAAGPVLRGDGFPGVVVGRSDAPISVDVVGQGRAAVAAGTDNDRPADLTLPHVRDPARPWRVLGTLGDVHEGILARVWERESGEFCGVCRLTWLGPSLA